MSDEKRRKVARSTAQRAARVSAAAPPIASELRDRDRQTFEARRDPNAFSQRRAAAVNAG